MLSVSYTLYESTVHPTVKITKLPSLWSLQRIKSSMTKYNFKQRKSKRTSIPLPREMASLRSSWSGVVKSGHDFLVGVVLAHDSVSPSLTLANLCRPPGKGANSWRPTWPPPPQAHGQPSTGLKCTREHGKVAVIDGRAGITAERGQTAEAAGPGAAPVQVAEGLQADGTCGHRAQAPVSHLARRRFKEVVNK